MKTTLILAAAALIAVGCDQQKKAEKRVEAEINREAQAKQEVVDAQARAAKTVTDAEQARAAIPTVPDVGGIGEKVQTEIGTDKGPPTSTLPSTAPLIPATPGLNSALDQQLADQVLNAINGDTEAKAEALCDIEVSATAGCVTLKGP